MSFHPLNTYLWISAAASAAYLWLSMNKLHDVRILYASGRGRLHQTSWMTAMRIRSAMARQPIRM